MSRMKQPFRLLSFEYTPTSPLAWDLLDELFASLGLERNQKRRAKAKDIESRRTALLQIVSTLLITLNMTERHYCSRTIKRNSFSKEDFGRDTFDAVIQRLEGRGYVQFERGTREPYSGYLSRVFLQRKLVTFFKKAGIDRSNVHDHFGKRRRQSLKSIHMVEAKTSSTWSNGVKVSGEDVPYSRLSEHPKFIEQITLMQELNSFLYRFNLRGPKDTSFSGLKRQFNNYANDGYSFNQGGRLYSHFHSNDYQSLSGANRSKLNIDGEPVVEMDMHACALSITHALFGVPLPDKTDLYDIEGVDRAIIKSWINLSLSNGRPLMRWPNEVTETFDIAGLKYNSASHYAPIICHIYPFIANLGAQQIGWARLQFEESQVIVGAIQELMGMGIPSYPVHDSLIVAKSTQRVAERVLEEFFLDSLGGRVILK